MVWQLIATKPMRIGQGMRRRVLYNVQRFQSDLITGLFTGDENNFP